MALAVLVRRAATVVSLRIRATTTTLAEEAAAWVETVDMAVALHGQREPGVPIRRTRTPVLLSPTVAVAVGRLPGFLAVPVVVLRELLVLLVSRMFLLQRRTAVVVAVRAAFMSMVLVDRLAEQRADRVL